MAVILSFTIMFTGCTLETLKSPFRFNLSKLKDSVPSTGRLHTASSTDPAIARELSDFKSFPFDINMVDIHGQPVRLSDYRGKVVIVDFWGTWCGPCRRVIPHLVSLQAQYPADLQVIGLCNERTTDTRVATTKLTNAMEESGINYPCVLIDDQTMRSVPNFSGYPTMLFLDRLGNVRMSTVGVKPEEYFEAILSQLLAEPSQSSEPAARTASTR